MKKRSIALAVVFALSGALVLAVSNVAGSSPKPAATKSGSATKFSDITVTGTCSNHGLRGVFVGTLSVTQFVYQNGAIDALGTLDGTCTVASSATPMTSQAVSVPAAPGTHTCKILKLDLGPLHLSVLGLVVDLAPVHLTIKAIGGPGLLLGNLLCLIAHLLDGVGPPPLPVVAPLLDAALAMTA